MNERIHRCLDGDLSRSELNPEELSELVRYEEIARDAAELHRSAVAPDIAATVRSRVSAMGDPVKANATAEAGSLPAHTRLGKAAAWLWTPRPVRFRPVWGALALAFLVAFGVVSLDESRDVQPSALEGPGAPASAVLVQFRLEAPEASAVRLAGNFTGWEPVYELQQTAPGIWSVFVPLEPGVYDYSFVVNGMEWTPDPLAPAVNDGFGGVNSRLSVLLAGEA